LVTTNDDLLGERLRILRVHGGKPKYFHRIIGGNFRIDAIQAAVLNVKFPHLDTWTKARQENAELYTKLFKAKNLSDILLPEAVYKSSGLSHYHIYNQYVIRVQKRDELREFLKSNDIGSEIYYPVPFHKQECFSYLKADNTKFPVSDYLADHSLALPIYPELRKEQIEFVVDTITKFEKENIEKPNLAEEFAK
jgi:dTDP-4-amino-4,6-dideoxygalactose transaminase